MFPRNLKKAELQLKVTSDALEQVKFVYAKVKSQLDIAPKDDGTLFQKRKELQKEVDLAKKTLAQQVRKLKCFSEVFYTKHSVEKQQQFYTTLVHLHASLYR